MQEHNYVIKAYISEENGLSMVSKALCLAEALLTRGCQVTIVTNEPVGRRYFKCYQIQVISIPLHEPFEKELQTIRSLVDTKTVLILTDGKHVNEYFGLVNPCRLILLADVCAHLDASIDLFISSLSLERPSSFNVKHSLCGLEYHFIKKSILKSEKVVLRPTPERILLALDDSGNKELSVMISSVLNDVLKQCHITVLLGAGYNRVGFIEKRLSGISDDIEVLRNVQNIESLYHSFDFAFCKGNTLCYELMFLGMPLVIVSTSEQQRLNFEYLTTQNAVVHGGTWDHLSPTAVKEQALDLYHNYEKRSLLSQNARKLIDGKGVTRIMESIESL